MASCFWNRDMSCECDCMAYEKAPDINGGKPTCVILRAAKAVADGGGEMTQQVRPVGATPPEVRI